MTPLYLRYVNTVVVTWTGLPVEMIVVEFHGAWDPFRLKGLVAILALLILTQQ